MPFLLVHSPFLGPKVWEPLGSTLTDMGHEVVAPYVRPACLTAAEPYDAAARRIAGSGSDGAVVVMHSGAGAWASSIWAADPRLTRYIFLDALLPHPGRSWMETLPPAMSERLRKAAYGARLPAWPKWLPAGALEALLPNEHLRAAIVGEAFEASLSYADAKAPGVEGWRKACRCGYLQLSEGYAEEARRAETLGMSIERFPGDHLSLATAPQAVAGCLLDLAGQLGWLRRERR